MSNKGSNNNVGSIEEHIKILENLKSYLNLLVYDGNDKIIYNDLLWDEKTVDCINAIEHLINNYTRQKQINEEHQKINGELREKVKELEKYTIHLTDKEYRKVIESAQMDTSNDRVIAHKFAVMQQQLEQKNNRIQELEEEKNKYLQKLVYALSPTRHVLGDDYNDAFKKIIAENIDLETCKIRQKLKECWGIDKKY